MKQYEISKKDFVLVQQDHKIHDLKFETKPTTYMKDAMRRFVKNKSSVIAGIIIGILIILSILVPIINKNDIVRSQNEYRFLPPRWPGFENSNILNGKRNLEGIVLDQTDPDPANHHPVGYERRAVVGEMERYQGTTNLASIHASGGVLAVSSDGANFATGVQTNKVTADFAANNFYVDVEISETLNHGQTYEIYALVYYNGPTKDAKKLVLKEISASYGNFHEENFSTMVLDNRPVGNVQTTFTSQIGIYIPASFDKQNFATLYINSLEVKPKNDSAVNPFELHNFTEANELLLRRSNSEQVGLRYQTVLSGVLSLYEGIVTRVNFQYDFYEQVYGEKLFTQMGKSELEKYKALGYIDYTFIDGDAESIANTFVILNEEKSPIREIVQSYKKVQGSHVFYEYDVIVSNYRLLGYNHIPYFLFGTNDRGQDFFKIVFKGLQTSLILGFSAAAVNILIGLVWGSISGYYGGNVDLAMERFTDILGGIPWIIVMTLTILHLGNNLGVFLLSLILTGWIGISSITRSQFYRYKRREYVLASRTLGAKDGRLIFKHILPNSIGPIVTSAVMMIPGVIFSEATISYLGLGLQGLTSFGVALSEVQAHIGTDPYLIVSGSIIIALLMISFNLFGNGLRDAFNPSLKGAE